MAEKNPTDSRYANYNVFLLDPMYLPLVSDNPKASETLLLMSVN